MRTVPSFNYKQVPCFGGAITATKTSLTCDALGAETVSLVYSFGTTTTGTSGTVTIKLTHSDDDSSYSDVTSATTAALTTDTGGQNAKKVVILVNCKQNLVKRYVRAVMTVAGTVSTGATGPDNAGGVLQAGPLSANLTTSQFDTVVSI